MNASKFIVSTASALMVVGGIGLAYAQTTNEPTHPASPAPDQMQTPSTQAPMQSTQPSDTTVPQTSDTTAPQTSDTASPTMSDTTTPQSGQLDAPQDDLAPQADRN